METYEILSLIGCVLGLLLAILVLGQPEPEQTSLIYGLMISGLIVYVNALIVTFLTKSKKAIGITLIVSAVLVLLLTSLYGVIGFALLLPAGIIAWRKRNRPIGETSPA
jgi:hypothetical protein